jgi:hypothetical protein
MIRLVDGDLYLDADFTKADESIFVDNGDILPRKKERFSVGADHNIVANYIEAKNVSAKTIKALSIDATGSIHSDKLIASEIRIIDSKTAKVTVRI